MLNPLTAVSPIDGRYHSKSEALSEYFSEYALFKYRVKVEAEYFIALCKLGLPQLVQYDETTFDELRKLYNEFSVEDAMEIKEIEETTNHDIKAVEYFIKRRLDSEFIHFGLTSQDINNTSIPLALKDAVENVYIPRLRRIINLLLNLSDEWDEIPMLAHTHGQPASPTRVGKEIAVFCSRLEEQLDQLNVAEYPAKFGGATGNMNAHHVAYPEIDWHDFARTFVEETLGLKRSFPTTQIEHYDNLAAIFDNMRRIDTILIDLCRDFWTYISMGYFKQKVKSGEVGSSAMPHKVNPIDFENAEGNLMLAGAIFNFLSDKLPVSRLQRDLTDSTVLRNIGVPVAHSIIAFSSIEKGLGKVMIDTDSICADLEENWAVVAEGIQTILRREGFPKPYEALKALTRTGGKIDRESIRDFIDTLDVDESVKEELRSITPHNYIGM